MDKQKVALLADKYGWVMIDYQKNIEMVSFAKTIHTGGVSLKRFNLDNLEVIRTKVISKTTRINIYLTKGTVGTCLDHPKRGKTQLFRRNISYYQLEKIFQNPRIHTGKGYYVKK